MNAQTTIDSVHEIARARLAIGAPCDPPGGSRVAYVVAIGAATGNTYTICGSPAPMSRDRLMVTIASESGQVSELSENILAPMLYRARHLAPISEADAAALWDRAKAAQARMREQLAREREEADRAKAAAREDVARYAPAWAVSAIIAEQHEDASDSYTDYHNHRTLRRVVIGWSRHKRDLFAEMRKAAATFPETAHLETAPDSAEHREKYSMGAGFYLKQGWRDSSGWCVKKSPIAWLSSDVLEFTDAAKAGDDIAKPARARPAASAAAPTGETAGRFTVSEHVHSKKGFRMWIATLSERVEREEFDQLSAAARALGGWYSRPWAGTPGGFAFKCADKCAAFTGDQPGDPLPPTGGDEPTSRAPRADRPAAPAPAMGDKLRAMADGMQSAIDDKFRDRLANTPKRSRQAAEARLDGEQLQRAQRIMRALADLHDSGTVPAALARVSTKAALVELAREDIERSGGYYDAGRGTGRPYPWREADKLAQAAAAWALLDTSRDAAARGAENLRQKIAGLQFAKIPGYFPTPSPIVASMLDAADLLPGSRVLEPSAGSGAIADAARDAGYTVDCIERHATLAAILGSKGHSVRQGDFMEHQPQAGGFYDAVIMNPPFEDGQDLQHVRHAFDFLRPGGSLVAIMGAGVTFRKDRRYSEFREWAEEQGARFEDIPAGAFKASGTGVASVMVSLIKAEG